MQSRPHYGRGAADGPTERQAADDQRRSLAALSGARQRLRELDADLPIFSVRSMRDWLSRSIAQPRLNAVLLTAFGCLALLIATIGVHGVLSYLVNQRTREIGLWIALGAQRSRVIGFVIKEGMMLALTGIAAGVWGALAGEPRAFEFVIRCGGARRIHVRGHGYYFDSYCARGLHRVRITRVEGGYHAGVGVRIGPLR